MMSDAQAMYFTSEVGSSVLWRYNCMWSARLAVLFRFVLSSYRVGVLSVFQSREIQSASCGKSLKNERGASIARAAPLAGFLWRRTRARSETSIAKEHERPLEDGGGNESIVCNVGSKAHGKPQVQPRRC